MTNKQKYKQAFSVLHTSKNFDLEVEKMNVFKRKHMVKNIAAVFAVCVCVVGVSGAAYAADIGGVQRTIQLWIHGDQTDATLAFDLDGTYDMQYHDANGNIKQQSGGGVAIDDDGTERPLTQEELLEEIYAPEVEYQEDGSVWLYYYDQKIDITDKFEDGICYVKLQGEDKTLYLTVKYQKGYAMSEKKYILPQYFN